jgi:hypothetical protein
MGPAKGFAGATGNHGLGVRERGVGEGVAMDEDEARKTLKVFGLQVTQFIGRRRELKNIAVNAIEGQDRTTVAAVLASLVTETSELHRRWLEVTNLVLEEEREAYSEMARLLEQAGQTELPRAEA